MAREEQVAGSSILLRQRYRTLGQLRTHLHPVEGSLVLYFRPPAGAASPPPGRPLLETSAGGARVVLEVHCDENGQQAILRGAILGRSTGEERGLWLEFPDTSLLRRVDERKVAFRGQRRVGCEKLIHVVTRGAPQLARLVDLSLNGAQVSGVSGYSTGDAVAVRLLGSQRSLPVDLGEARVVFSGAKGVGLRFERSRSESRQAITQVFGRMQEEWHAAPEAVHPAICCQSGTMLEPALPRVRSRHRFS